MRRWSAARLLRLELRHNAKLWVLPVAIALFWLTTYRKAMAMPPLWNLRAASMQSGGGTVNVLAERAGRVVHGGGHLSPAEIGETGGSC